MPKNPFPLEKNKKTTSRDWDNPTGSLRRYFGIFSLFFKGGNFSGKFFRFFALETFNSGQFLKKGGGGGGLQIFSPEIFKPRALASQKLQLK